MKHFAFLCVILLSFNAHSQQCLDLFAGPLGEQAPAPVHIPPPSALDSRLLFKKQPIEVIREFKGPHGSLRLILQHPYRRNEAGLQFIMDHLLFRLGGFNLNDIAGYQGAMKFLKDLSPKVIRQAHKGDWGAITQVYNYLKVLEYWLQKSRPGINLTSAEGLLSAVNIHGSTEVPWPTLQKQYQDYTKQSVQAASDKITIEDANFDVKLREFSDIGSRLTTKYIMGPGGLHSFVQRQTTAELVELLSSLTRRLHFRREQEEYLISDLETLARHQPVRISSADRALIMHQVSLLQYFLENVYLAKFPEARSAFPHTLSMYADFARVQSAILGFDAFYKIQEIRLEESLHNIESLNASVDLLKADLHRTQQIVLSLGKDGQAWNEKLIDIQGRLESLKIQDLNDQQFASNATTLERLHFMLDRLSKDIHGLREKTDIVQFRDLNFDWAQVLPLHTYRIRGLDYERVVFTKDVLDFFEHRSAEGAYFLAALSKGYVGHQTYSGLRKIPAIHSDFRDIKVIKHGGKIRIVGKLVGKTIVFFHVYNEDRPYNDTFMRRLIEHYQAPQIDLN